MVTNRKRIEVVPFQSRILIQYSFLKKTHFVSVLMHTHTCFSVLQLEQFQIQSMTVFHLEHQIYDSSQRSQTPLETSSILKVNMEISNNHAIVSLSWLIKTTVVASAPPNYRWPTWNPRSRGVWEDGSSPVRPAGPRRRWWNIWQNARGLRDRRKEEWDWDSSLATLIDNCRTVGCTAVLAQIYAAYVGLMSPPMSPSLALSLYIYYTYTSPPSCSASSPPHNSAKARCMKSIIDIDV